MLNTGMHTYMKIFILKLNNYVSMITQLFLYILVIQFNVPEANLFSEYIVDPIRLVLNESIVQNMPLKGTIFVKHP